MVTQPLIPARVQRRLTMLVVHCSATPSGKWLAGPAPVIINTWHRDRKPAFLRAPEAVARFNPSLGSIGYHYIVDLDGTTYSGRSLEEVGAHAQGSNANSVGICLVGGLEPGARYTAAQWDALAALVKGLRRLLAQGALIVGHRDLSPDANGDGNIAPNEWLKTCPGFDVAGWLARGMKPLQEQIWTK